MPNNRKKDYILRNQSNEVVSIDDYRQAPWLQTYANRAYDFRRWLYIGRPELDKQGKSKEFDRDGNSKILVHAGRDGMVEAIRNAIWHMPSKEGMTKNAYCKQGVSYWFEYLDYLDAAGQPVYELVEIEKDIIECYINWLRHIRKAETETGRLSFRSAKSIFTSIKPIFKYLEHQKAFPEGVFPRNPFPNSNRSKKGFQPYPKKVLTDIMRALCLDYKGLRDGTLTLSPAQSLTVRLMIIAARTGRNMTPLLELTRNAVKKHPIKPERLALLVTYKRRGSNTSIQAFDVPEPIVDMAPMPMDTVTIYNEVITLTEPLVAELPAGQQDRLWLFRQRYGGNRVEGEVAFLNDSNYIKAITAIISRHNLKDEKGNPIKLNISRLRKTFGQRMWDLTGGDIIATAQQLNNEPKIADQHYVAVMPEMKANFRRLGLIMHADWAGKLDDIIFLSELSRNTGLPLVQIKSVVAGYNNTGVGRCSDPYHGKMAPEDGNLCTRWLECFRCTNLLVMESDLHRLFSFYYLLLKERNTISRSKWNEVFGQIISIIDDEIIVPNLRTKENPKGCFDPYKVQQARTKAQTSPHTMWLDRSILGSLT